MTRLEFTELFEKELKPLWPKWEPGQEMIDLYAETFLRHEPEDVRQAVRRHKVLADYLEPKIPRIIDELRKVIGERKDREQREHLGVEWPGQVFVVVVHNAAGETVRLFDFHVPNPRAQVPRDFESRRMQMHVDNVSGTRQNQYPDCNFSGEIHTEETWRKRESEFRLERMTPEQQARAAKTCLRTLDGEPLGKIFREMFK